MHEPISTAQIAAHGGIALFGAIVHAAKAHRQGTSKTLIDFLILTLMASFTGVMFSFIGIYLFADNLYVSMCMAGTGGFLGVEGMTMIIDRVRILISK